MRRILPFLLICCLLLASCVKVEGKSADSPNGEQSGAASAQDKNTVETTGNAEAAAQETTQAEPFALYPAYLQLPMGQHVTLDADTAPAGKKLTWSSSDASVATVDESGRVTPVAEGEAVITAALADDVGVAATCGVLVAAEGSIFLWEYEPGPEEKEALRAALDAQPASEEEQAGVESP